MVKILDIHFLNTSETIASFLLETDTGPILFECGPHSAIKELEKELNKHSYTISDIKHLFLTHIHFDHAGAAWVFAENGCNIYVHPKGYKHLLDPTRLYGSAKRIYGDQMEYLWGRMEGISEDLLFAVEDKEIIRIGELEIHSLHTPGHASHHIAWKIGDIAIVGDVAGCKINGGPVVPPCPPPDINIEEWEQSINLLLSHNLREIYLTHFGRVTDIEDHMNELKNVLWDWANFIKPYYENKTEIPEIIPKFALYARNNLKMKGLSDKQIDKYEKANPAWMSVAGLMRYWHKKTEMHS